VTLGEVLRRAAGHLDRTSETGRLDAELLLAHALGRSRIELYTDLDRPLTEAEVAAYRQLVARRSRREPVAYILGEWGFRRLTLKVDPRALIPRPETEVVVERCLALLAGHDSPRVLDVGVGSGAIALAIADEHPGASVVAVDRSEGALALARENLVRTGLEARVTLVRGHLLDGVAGPFDLVVSNPPYVPATEWESLQPEIRLFEPRDAVVGDRVWEAVAARARGVLASGGRLVLECGDGQADGVAAGLRGLGYEDVLATPDLAGRPRVVGGRRP
jgi:release factor glutamine methyltransferase